MAPIELTHTQEKVTGFKRTFPTDFSVLAVGPLKMDFEYNRFSNELHRPLPLLNDGRMLQQANCRDGARTEYWHAAAHQPRKLRPDANEWRVHRQDRNIFTNAKKVSLAQGLDQTGELESDSFTHTGTCAQDAHVTLSLTGAEG